MKKLLTIFVFLISLIIYFFISDLLITENVYSASTLVINGLPINKVMSDIEGTELINLSKDEQYSYRLLITKNDGKFFWTSRENRELLFNQTGRFYNFIEPNGAGYIKVAKIKGKYLYMEHLTLGFKNITYWGVAEEFNTE